ncbi:uncharacterized protein LOC103312876 [Tribolium castaneum]|uniref:uncharacterized protein LOC103312876 n=1 Tax=Tribolium castaneum TaxID=7070 RepID=UPI0030FE18B6
MAQCFVSTYRNHYRWPDPQFTKSAHEPYDNFVSVIPPEDIWIGADTGEDKLDAAALEKRLRKCYLKRLITTYQYDYCKDLVAKFIGEPANIEIENQLLQSAKNLYDPDSRPKIAPPLPGTRKVFGYIRPSRNYTPLTTYQFFIGKTGYQMLKGMPQAELQQQDEKGEDLVKKPEKIEAKCECYCCSRK